MDIRFVEPLLESIPALSDAELRGEYAQSLTRWKGLEDDAIGQGNLSGQTGLQRAFNVEMSIQEAIEEEQRRRA